MQKVRFLAIVVREVRLCWTELIFRCPNILLKDAHVHACSAVFSVFIPTPDPSPDCVN
jgi:hypothetical protein